MLNVTIKLVFDKWLVNVKSYAGPKNRKLTEEYQS